MRALDRFVILGWLQVVRNAMKLAVTLLLIIVGICACAFIGVTGYGWFAHRNVGIDLPNFHQVNDYLYRGGAPSIEGIHKLKKMGIKTIVDLRSSPVQDVLYEKYLSENLGLKHVNLPMTSRQPPDPLQEQIFVSTMQKAASDPNVAPVFIHCKHGVDRTGFMIGMWRVQCQNWSVAQAAAEIISYGGVDGLWRMWLPRWLQSRPALPVSSSKFVSSHS